MNYLNKTFDIETKELEKIRFAFATSINKTNYINSDQVEFLIDKTAHHMTFRLIHDVYGEKAENKIIKWPATWWDHFKLRFFPKWLLKRYPAYYASAEFIVGRIYPDVRGLGRVFQYVEMSAPDKWWKYPYNSAEE